jgi:hypothetical protein
LSWQTLKLRFSELSDGNSFEETALSIPGTFAPYKYIGFSFSVRYIEYARKDAHMNAKAVNLSLF